MRGGIVCLGPFFRPGTSIRPLVEQIYRIVSGRDFATGHAFDGEACEYYLSHLDQVRALRAAPLWRRPLATRAGERRDRSEPDTMLSGAARGGSDE